MTTFKITSAYDGTDFVGWQRQASGTSIHGLLEDALRDLDGREVTVIGSELTAICDYNVSQYKIKTFANKHVRQSNGFKAEEGALHQVECAPEEPLLAELRAFVESVQTRKPPRADGWAGYDSVRVLEAAMESAKTARTIQLK